jgi:DNA uptake protein ComE-like DNA-binding protein
MNINEASHEDLIKAFQVDGQRAEYIIRKRDELGGFESWEQFKREVPGFEDKMVENLEQAGLEVGRDTQAAGAGRDHGAATWKEQRGRRDINDATREELKDAFQVDGVRAEYIIRKRDELGGFESWEQFKREVPGFEDKMVENLEQAGLTLSPRRKH